MLSNKSEAFKAFFQFKTHVELQLDLKIKSIQSDWGGEYRAFTNFLQDHGFTIEYPAQNLINKMVLQRGNIDI